MIQLYFLQIIFHYRLLHNIDYNSLSYTINPHCLPVFHIVVCCCLVAKSCSTLLRPHGLFPPRLLCPWDFPGKNTGMGCYFLLQGIFPPQKLNQRLPHCRWILYQLSRKESTSCARENLEVIKLKHLQEKRYNKLSV